MSLLVSVGLNVPYLSMSYTFQGLGILINLSIPQICLKANISCVLHQLQGFVWQWIRKSKQTKNPRPLGTGPIMWNQALEHIARILGMEAAVFFKGLWEPRKETEASWAKPGISTFQSSLLWVKM